MPLQPFKSIDSNGHQRNSPCRSRLATTQHVARKPFTNATLVPELVAAGADSELRHRSVANADESISKDMEQLDRPSMQLLLPSKNQTSPGLCSSLAEASVVAEP